MTTVYIFALEPLDNRYTQQWLTAVPNILEQSSFKTVTILGEQRVKETTNGAFLNFSDTNYWKSSQLMNFIKMMDDGNIEDDAIILFTDFWNPVITQIAYMRDLLDKNWKIHSIAHAGAYDPSDILGYKMKRPWPNHAEQSWFHACDVVYFASEFHRTMFLTNLRIDEMFWDKAVFAGQPYEYLTALLAPNISKEKQNRVMWPHRYNHDKQPSIAEDLSSDFDMCITQKLDLSKQDYYDLLGRSKVVFSCSLHENLGMSMIEGTLSGCIPIVPDRASYSEIYLDEFKYPSEWTYDVFSFNKFRPELVNFINEKLNNFDAYSDLIAQQRDIITSTYTSSQKMVDTLGKDKK